MGNTTLSPDMQELSAKVLDLATASWDALKRSPEVTQEIAKDPFTGPIKEQSGIAEFLLLLLHVCDRIASAAFRATVSEHAAATLRHSFMGALVGARRPLGPGLGACARGARPVFILGSGCG